MLYKRMALTASGVRSPAVGGGYFRGVPLSFKRTLTVPARSHANVDGSRESSLSSNGSRPSALLSRGIPRMARTLFQNLLDERYTRPVLVHE